VRSPQSLVREWTLEALQRNFAETRPISGDEKERVIALESSGDDRSANSI
jgi:hypothetical protein